MSFPETVSDSLFRNDLVVQTHNFISCLGGEVKKPDVEVLGWPGYPSSADVRPVGRTANSLKQCFMLEK
jgi:hypothetical protein